MRIAKFTCLTALSATALVIGIQPANADQQILDDLIVDGSACIGQDCVNGESFGFDTLRLKENNLRIKFDDTSTSASFPSNDWQLTANDSANGGANKFSIDDISGGRTPFTIEAGARTNALYVDDGGRIGVGTSTPVANIHAKTGNTPTLRLEQDGTSGFTPQTWDLAGNETNFFVRDATNGSTLPLRIFPGAPSSALTIEATTGDIGLGTTSPDAELDIEGSSSPGLRFSNTGTAGGSWDIFMNSNTGRFNIRDNSGNTIPVKMDVGAISNLISFGINTAGTTETSTVSIGRDGTSAVLDVEGSIVVNGTTEHPDYVFDKENYDLDSIEEQADFMWKNKHLPSLPKAPEGLRGPVNLIEHQMGLLEELEKAHIYIEQLHENLKELNRRVNELELNEG